MKNTTGDLNTYRTGFFKALIIIPKQPKKINKTRLLCVEKFYVKFPLSPKHMAIEAPVQRRSPADIMLGVIGSDRVTGSPAIEANPTSPVIDPKPGQLALRREERAFIRLSGVENILAAMASGLNTIGLEGRIVSNYREEDIPQQKKNKYDSDTQMFYSDTPKMPNVTLDKPYEVGIAIGLPGEHHGAVRVSVAVAKDEKGDFAGLKFANKDILAAPSNKPEDEEAFITRFSASIKRLLPRFSASKEPKTELIKHETPATAAGIFKDDLEARALVEETRKMLAKNGIIGVAALRTPNKESSQRESLKRSSKGGLHQGIGSYDSSLQMFVEEPREPDMSRISFLRWLVENDRLEHGKSGPSSGEFVNNEANS